MQPAFVSRVLTFWTCSRGSCTLRELILMILTRPAHKRNFAAVETACTAAIVVIRRAQEMMHGPVPG